MFIDFASGRTYGGALGGLGLDVVGVEAFSCSFMMLSIALDRGEKNEELNRLIRDFALNLLMMLKRIGHFVNGFLPQVPSVAVFQSLGYTHVTLSQTPLFESQDFKPKVSA